MKQTNLFVLHFAINILILKLTKNLLKIYLKTTIQHLSFTSLIKIKFNSQLTTFVFIHNQVKNISTTAKIRQVIYKVNRKLIQPSN